MSKMMYWPERKHVKMSPIKQYALFVDVMQFFKAIYDFKTFPFNPVTGG